MKRLVIKLSGELFSYNREMAAKACSAPVLNSKLVKDIIDQIKSIAKQHQVGLVIGGGNFFRGAISNHKLGLTKTTAHNIGMLSTFVNGIVLKELLCQANIPSIILSAIECPSIARLVSQQTIDEAFDQGKTIIFVGGTGNPFFTTDTSAVLRALQIGAEQVFKGTKVDGVYDKDPLTHKDSKLYKTIDYQKVLNEKIGNYGRNIYQARTGTQRIDKSFQSICPKNH